MIVTRIGDTAFGICFWPPPPAGPGPQPATGIVVSGDPVSLESGPPISRTGDMVAFPCGIGIIATGTTNELNSGLPTSTLGSTVVGPIIQAMITTGAPNNLSM